MRAAAEFKKKHQLYIRYAYANLKDSDDAEVIVQDAYVLALEKEIDIFSEEGRRWLWKTLKYLVLKKNRKKKKRAGSNGAVYAGRDRSFRGRVCDRRKDGSLGCGNG